MKTELSSNRQTRPLACALVLAMSMTSPSLLASESLTLDQAAPPVPVEATTSFTAVQPARTPRIQIAILLDTSSSMDGLIDQARNQLWQVVNQFTGTRRGGVVPTLEIALYDYGNNRADVERGYVRQFSEFTRELDAVSQGLFALTTSGGEEFCGVAIERALQDLQWSTHDDDIKMIFIAGNESFAQGPVPYQYALQRARNAGVSVNTIHAGTDAEGMRDGWRQAALLAGGDYLAIDTAQTVVHIDAPQDQRLAELNAQLNQTYLPYGSAGAGKAVRQVEQDRLSSDISAGLLAKRTRAKASSYYGNADWDLVDALEDGELAEEAVVEMEAADLPEPMREMAADERLRYVTEKRAERDAIQQEIRELSDARADYVMQQKAAQAAAAPSVSDALTGAIERQAEQKQFTLAN